MGFEFLLRRGVVTLVADPLGSPLGADMAAILVGFPPLAGGIAWWGTRRGVDPADWDYEVSLRTVGAGVAGALAAFVLYAVLASVYTTVLGIEPSVAPAAPGTGNEATWAPAYSCSSTAPSCRSPRNSPGAARFRPPSQSPTGRGSRSP